MLVIMWGHQGEAGLISQWQYCTGNKGKSGPDSYDMSGMTSSTLMFSYWIKSFTKRSSTMRNQDKSKVFCNHIWTETKWVLSKLKMIKHSPVLANKNDCSFFIHYSNSLASFPQIVTLTSGKPYSLSLNSLSTVKHLLKAHSMLGSRISCLCHLSVNFQMV